MKTNLPSPRGRKRRYNLLAIAALTVVLTATAAAQSTNGKVGTKGTMTETPVFGLLENVETKIVAPNQLTMSAQIARLNGFSKAAQFRIQRLVMDLNISASIGTLRYDEETGKLTMYYHVNPQQVSKQLIDAALDRFAERARKCQVLFANLNSPSVIK